MIPEYTLSEVVKFVINNWLEAGTSFSAHQVTEEIRRQTNAGEYFVEDADMRPDGKLEIIHDEVKSVIDSLYQAREIECDKKFNGTYFVYSPLNDDLDDLVDPSLLGVTQSSQSQSQPPQVKPDYSVDDEKKDIIVGYVARKLKEGEQPTLKQIQSRMKGIPILLQGIADVLKEEGYMLSVEDYLTYVKVVG